MSETEIPEGWIPDDELLQFYYGMRASQEEIDQAESVARNRWFVSRQCRWFLRELMLERRRFEIAVGLLVDFQRKLQEAYDKRLEQHKLHSQTEKSLQESRRLNAGLSTTINELESLVEKLRADLSEARKELRLRTSAMWKRMFFGVRLTEENFEQALNAMILRMNEARRSIPQGVIVHHEISLAEPEPSTNG
jgi:septal ring factor EnvC (AmiA/AmiB activator)